MVNLIKVKRTSIAVIAALNAFVYENKHVSWQRKIYTERHYQDVLGSFTKHGEEFTLQRLKSYI